MSNSAFDGTLVRELISIGQASAGPQAVEGGNIPYVLVPNDHKAQAMPELIYNDHAAKPERKKASLTVLDPNSFIEYFKLFRNTNSRVFAYEPETSVTAILDYHATGDGDPAWCQHKLRLDLQQSEEWGIWIGANNKLFTQQGFAEFLEQNSLDIVKPAPAQIIEVARDLNAKSEVEFGSGLRMGDGQIRFRYSETVKTTVGADQLTVPEQFTVSIPVFIGGERLPVESLLRFRVKDQKLAFFYTLIRPAEVLRTAFACARDLIEDTLDMTIINGNSGK